MASTTSAWDSEFCAEHDGSIASFARLDVQLGDISQFADLFIRDSKNLAQASKIAGAVIVGSAMMTPAALIAAPALGGAVGTTFLGLSGAAATNAGLAVIGGGSIAAGGAGIAGGTAILTATGAALGGVLGGVVSNGYFGDIEGFEIERIQNGRSPAIIVIDGFLTQRKQEPTDWLKAVSNLYPDQECFYVRWESKRLAQIGHALGEQVSRDAITKVVASWAKSAAKKGPASLGPAGIIVGLASLASNPWTTAMLRAEMAGVLLADIISRTKGEYIVCGHSLGARVAHYALLSLATKKTGAKVREAHLMGGAVGNHEDSWKVAKSAVSGSIFNYHSEKDDVLRCLYSTGTLFLSEPIGRNQIMGVKGVTNKNVTQWVGGHGEYKSKFTDFAETDSEDFADLGVRENASAKATKKAATKSEKKAVKATKKSGANPAKATKATKATKESPPKASTKPKKGAEGASRT